MDEGALSLGLGCVASERVLDFMIEKAVGWICRMLEHRRLPVFLAVLAVVVMLPALGHGWFLDDMMFRARFLNSSGISDSMQGSGGLFKSTSKLRDAMSGLYVFFDEDGAESVMDYGVIPWWSDPDCLISFWRPVTSFTMWLDYQLYPISGALQHLHSFVWFGGWRCGGC